MVSLLKLATVTEEGVRFLSPHDGSPMYDNPLLSSQFPRPRNPQLQFHPSQDFFPIGANN